MVVSIIYNSPLCECRHWWNFWIDLSVVELFRWEGFLPASNNCGHRERKCQPCGRKTWQFNCTPDSETRTVFCQLQKPAQIGTACMLNKIWWARLPSSEHCIMLKSFQMSSSYVSLCITYRIYRRSSLSLVNAHMDTSCSQKYCADINIFSQIELLESHADTWKTPQWHNGDMFCVCFHDTTVGVHWNGSPSICETP